MTSLDQQAALSDTVTQLITASKGSVLIPDPLLGASPLQCFGVIKVLLPALGSLQKQTGIAVPLTMVGLYQILFGALPTLFSTRNEWKKPIWQLSLASSLLLLASTIIILDLCQVFYIDWTRSTKIDFSSPLGEPIISQPNMLGWYQSMTQSRWVYAHPLFLSMGQITYEVAALIRASVLLPKPRARKALAGLTIAACLVHFVVPWTIVGYSLAKGRDRFEAHQASFSKAAVADVTFGVIIESVTNLAFLHQLAKRLGADGYVIELFYQKQTDSLTKTHRKAVIGLATSAGAFRLVTNIALAIATLCQIADPNFSQNPQFGGVFSLWVGWQINTFVQFSFVETKEIIVESASARNSNPGTDLNATGSQITKSEIRHAHGIRSEPNYGKSNRKSCMGGGGGGGGRKRLNPIITSTDQDRSRDPRVLPSVLATQPENDAVDDMTPTENELVVGPESEAPARRTISAIM
ncbi:hypothetical protein HDU86_007124 [Geranomyces michiganensis]|nr:hypothetical protein HDU86_007124 [Geranomyces michiganensis]